MKDLKSWNTNVVNAFLPKTKPEMSKLYNAVLHPKPLPQIPRTPKGKK